MGVLRKLLLMAGIGAALAYFFDPDNGQGRRDKLQRQVDEAVKKGREKLEKPLGSEAKSSPSERSDERPVAST
jgi:hypothetical protein